MLYNSVMASTDMKKTYEMLDVVQIPESIPEAGIKAGDIGVVDSVYYGGTMMTVEISSADNPVIVILDIKVLPDGALSVVSYTTFGS